MAIKRRTFLQQAGAAFAALGLSEAGLALWADRYQQALASPTRRKLALLVGINQYPESVCDYVSSRGSALNGCLTDVALQQELLIHRFGFQPSDILVLTDQVATRAAIEAAFMSHLVQQAQPGDVVLFHFSGLGSQLRLEGATPQLQQGLVPVDGTLPTPENPLIADLMQDTLGLLLKALATDQVISVIDAGFTSLGRTAQGNLRIRSRPDVPVGSIDPAELAFQEQLIQQTHLSQTQINQQWQTGQLPGTVFQASLPSRVATEAQWNGFTAGLFTYALTQQLWWSTPATTLWINFNQATAAVNQFAGVEQQPSINGQIAPKQLLPQTDVTNGADGVIRAVEEDGRAQIWLAGLPAVVLENSGASLFSIAPGPTAADPANLLIQLRGRDGLIAKARGLTPEATAALAAGRLVQESVRILPRNIGLTVAIDTSLERIERVDATSAFASVPRVSSVIAGEQFADFLFGKTKADALIAASLSPQSLLALEPPEDGAEEAPTRSPKSGYGLFYPSRAAIPNTLIQTTEAVKTAVNRLTPQLKTLLAIKLLRLTQNQGSSMLGVRASLELVAPRERLLLQQETVRAAQTPPLSRVANLMQAEGSPTLSIDNQIQYRLFNYSHHPVYFMLLGLDTKGNAVVLHSPKTVGMGGVGQQSRLIEAGETVTVPQTDASSWLIQSPAGLVETYLIFSRAPFSQTEQVLETEMRAQTDVRQIATLLNPLEVVQAVLQDLHQASSATLPITEVPTDAYALDVKAWATLSFVYQVTESIE